MTLPQIIFAAVVFMVGIPAAVGLRWRRFPLALRNPTALALVMAYFTVEALYRIGGRTLETHELILIDMAVIALIFCKAHRTPWDRIVLAIFALVWMAYYLPVSGWQQWWLLWSLSLAQFIAAGAESLEYMIVARAAGSSEAQDTPPPGAELALGGGR